MREERRLLRGVGDAAIARRCVGEVVFVAVAVLAHEVGVGVGKQAGEGAEDGALAAAGRTKDDGPVTGEVEIDVERERSERGAELQAVVMPERRGWYQAWS